MSIEIKVPTLGESVTEATIGQWFKQVGDAVKADEPLVELETDKVTIELPAPAAGTIEEISVKQGETVAVGAQWTTTSKQPADLVYELTKALWSEKTRGLMDAGHAKGKLITKENAVKGAGIPFHPGAEKFYKEIGLLK